MGILGGANQTVVLEEASLEAVQGILNPRMETMDGVMNQVGGLARTLVLVRVSVLGLTVKTEKVDSEDVEEEVAGDGGVVEVVAVEDLDKVCITVFIKYIRVHMHT